MTHHIVISSALSTGAREALTDHLSAPCRISDLLDTSAGTWTLEDANAAAAELAAAGYGYIDGSDFQFDVVPHEPSLLPTDTLDELVPALAAVDRIVSAADAIRTPEDPDPDNGLHVPFAILMQLQNVLRLAAYAQQGRLSHADINSQLPAVATMLARAVQEAVVA
ncbi:hypothetical protein [Curtobacterium sp. ISL-83]|uniref:hypothetical protein n=1 Tax=Curtobacterium sp. ISL-83 TaxID=2819145 RepID=UPI001BE720D4|nr:hypothetical protein [Curtobacterium sp. ISL-83]MBT2503002.1 hypothetical protein [Curtobacterium sp. ISL-83]